MTRKLVDKPWDEVAAYNSVYGKPLPSSLRKGEKDISWLLRGYSDALLSLAGSSSNGKERNAHLLERLEVASAWEFLGDCETNDEPEVQCANMAAFGLLQLGELCETVERGADVTTFVLLWDRIADAHMEAMGVALFDAKESGRIARSQLARKAANVRHSSSGKAAARRLVRECWEAWQQNPEQYRRPANFSRAMLDKFEELQSQAVIDRWVREWTRESSE